MLASLILPGRSGDGPGITLHCYTLCLNHAGRRSYMLRSSPPILSVYDHSSSFGQLNGRNSSANETRVTEVGKTPAALHEILS